MAGYQPEDSLGKAAEFKRLKEEREAATRRVHAVAKKGGTAAALAAGRASPTPAAADDTASVTTAAATTAISITTTTTTVAAAAAVSRSGLGAYGRVNFNLDENFEDAVEAVVQFIKGLRLQPAAYSEATATLEQIESAINISINPLKDQPPRDPDTRESILDRMQTHSHVRVQAYRPAQSDRLTYKFVYHFAYDVKDIEELLASMYALSDGQAPVSGRVGVAWEELVGVYAGVEADVAAKILDGTLVAVDARRPMITKAVRKAAAEGGLAADAGGEDTEDYSVEAVNQIRRDMSAKQILEGKATNLVLYKRYNPAAREIASLLERMVAMPQGVRELWDAPRIERSAMPTVVLKHTQDQTFPLFRQTEALATQRAAETSRAARVRRLKAELNSHMKESDSAGLTYDFGKPFSRADAEKRRAKLDIHNAEQAARRKRRKLAEAAAGGAGADEGQS